MCFFKKEKPSKSEFFQVFFTSLFTPEGFFLSLVFCFKLVSLVNELRFNWCLKFFLVKCTNLNRIKYLF